MSDKASTPNGQQPRHSGVPPGTSFRPIEPRPDRSASHTTSGAVASATPTNGDPLSLSYPSDTSTIVSPTPGAYGGAAGSDLGFQRQATAHRSINAALANIYTVAGLPFTDANMRLSEFLEKSKLEGYYFALQDAGVGDGDLGQLIQLGDEEIKELTSTVNMKPFHALVFRNQLRQLKENRTVTDSRLGAHTETQIPRRRPMSPSFDDRVTKAPNQDEGDTPMKELKRLMQAPFLEHHRAALVHSISLPNRLNGSYVSENCTFEESSKEAVLGPPSANSDDDDIDGMDDEDSMRVRLATPEPPEGMSPDRYAKLGEMSMIYGKNAKRSLTVYEASINKASLSLVLEDPNRLLNRSKLFDDAKALVMASGFKYKRGTSRSKLNPTARKRGVRLSKSEITQRRSENAQQQSQIRQQQIQQLAEKKQIAHENRQAALALLRIRSIEGDMDSVRRAQREADKFNALENELGKQISELRQKERKHQWYEQRKMAREASSASAASDTSNRTTPDPDRQLGPTSPSKANDDTQAQRSPEIAGPEHSPTTSNLTSQGSFEAGSTSGTVSTIDPRGSASPKEQPSTSQ